MAGFINKPADEHDDASKRAIDEGGAQEYQDLVTRSAQVIAQVSQLQQQLEKF